MNESDTRTELTTYLRSNFFPPLPLEYVDWVLELLPAMQDAVRDCDEGDLAAIDKMIPVPAAVLATGIHPKAMREGDDGPEIRMGDLISALRLYDHFTSDEES